MMPACNSLYDGFQFTGLIRGPTCMICAERAIVDISIHRPHTRPDLDFQIGYFHCVDFNSQASYEARRPPYILPAGYTNFNSQASYEARPAYIGRQKCSTIFQFTGLIRGPTPRLPAQVRRSQFQFTGLIRGPTFLAGSCRSYTSISIHRPHTRPD